VSTSAPALETAGQQMTRALAELGVIAHADDDAGNSWLAINPAGDDFPDADAAQLIVYLYDSREDWVFVNQSMERCAGTWRVAFDDGKREQVVFHGRTSAESTPATETAECVAFIADLLTKPSA
jgi:hypothetical protein